MSPATNAIMSAVPREKAGAGSAVNNTVRQVAGALGVAVLGSILAVTFRSHLGQDTPHQLASKLDGPAAVSRQLPAAQRVAPYATSDTSQSIADAELFIGQAQHAVESRYPKAVVAALRDPGAQSQLSGAERQKVGKLGSTLQPLGGFLASAKSSFMSAMNLTSVLGGIMALLGALVAWRFLPNRKQFAVTNGPVGAAQQREPSHLDAEAEPVPAHANHVAVHAAFDPPAEPDGRHEAMDEFGEPVIAEDRA